MPNQRQYKLSQRDHDFIFRDEIIPGHLYREDPTLPPIALPQSSPVAYLLAGQPGAGKSFCKGELLRRVGRKSRPVEVGSDLFRIYHTNYRDLQKSDDKTADFYTDLDARQWVEEAIDYAIEKNFSVLLDGTLSRPVVAKSLLHKFRAHKYSSQVLFLAVPKAVSQISNLLRYHLVCLEQGGFGRICLTDSHENSYDGVIDTAELIDAEKAANLVEVRRRHGEIRYLNHLLEDLNAWADEPPRGADVIRLEREYWTPREAFWFNETASQLKRQMALEWRTEIERIIGLAKNLKVNSVAVVNE